MFSRKLHSVLWKGSDFSMILFTITAIMMIIAAIIAIAIVGTFGGALLVVFGDVLIFVGIMWLIIKLIRRNKKK